LKFFTSPVTHRRFTTTLAIALAAAALSPYARAQASATATKANAISAFAGGTYSNPQYGPYYDKGFSFGGNLVQHVNRYIDPSLEARFNFTSGTDASERTYLVGLRAQTDISIVHPYGDILIGAGTLTFNLSNGQSYAAPRSTVFSYGGGADIDVFRQYQLKLDIQQQHWLLGDQPFHPWLAMVGVTYRFHFRDFVKQGEAR
jgi:hypothetical protein